MKYTNIQAYGADVLVYEEIDNPGYRYMNPSIAWHDNKLKIAIRSCNFAFEEGGKWYFRDGNAYSKTDVLYGDLNPETLQISNLTKLSLSQNTPTRVKVSGLEDVRLFSRKDGMHAIGFESDRLTTNLHNGSAAMAEFLIKNNELKYLRTLEKPKKEVVEKNWSPTDTPSEKFDFTYSDSQVWKNSKVIGEPTVTQIHGGSQLIKQDDGWLSIVHEKQLDPTLVKSVHARSRFIYDKYIYYSYLARHNEQGFITELSPPLRFGSGERVEFASGLVEHDGNLIISFGIGDRTFGFATADKSELVNLLKPVKSSHETHPDNIPLPILSN